VPVAEFGAAPASIPTAGPFDSHAPRTDAAAARIATKSFFMAFTPILRGAPPSAMQDSN
jgi:hypothetical protein